MAEARQKSNDLGIVLESYEGYASMSSFLFPHAPADRVVDATLFFNVLYYADDLFAADVIHKADMGDGDLVGQFVDAWHDGTVEPTRLEAVQNLLNAVVRVRNEVLQKSNPGFFERLTSTVVRHVENMIRPPAYDTLEGYLAMRTQAAGMIPTILMMEFANAAYVSESLLEEIPVLRSARDACVQIGGLSNDLFSYPKESHTEFNLVNVYLKLGLARELEEAVAMAIELVNEIHGDFRRARDAFEAASGSIQDPEALGHATSYMHGLEDVVAASYHWQMFTNRYRNKEHFFEDFR